MEFGRRRRRFQRRRGPRGMAVQTAQFRRAATQRRRPRRRRPRNARTGGFLGRELKFYDTNLGTQALVTNTDGSGGEADPSATILLNTVTQGDGEQQRDGRQILMKSVFVSGAVSCVAQANQTALDNGTMVGVWLVWDRQTNGATINSEDVFLNPNAGTLTSISLLRNLQHTRRFKVLNSWMGVVPTPQVAWDGTNVEQSGVIIPFKLSATLGIQVNYTGTTENVANIADNSLHIIAFCTDVGLVPTLSYNARLRFVG